MSVVDSGMTDLPLNIGDPACWRPLRGTMFAPRNDTWVVPYKIGYTESVPTKKQVAKLHLFKVLGVLRGLLRKKPPKWVWATPKVFLPSLPHLCSSETKMVLY